MYKADLSIKVNGIAAYVMRVGEYKTEKRALQALENWAEKHAQNVTNEARVLGFVWFDYKLVTNIALL